MAAIQNFAAMNGGVSMASMSQMVQPGMMSLGQAGMISQSGVLPPMVQAPSQLYAPTSNNVAGEPPYRTRFIN